MVKGGYKDLRAMRGQKTDGDWLTSTGAMMRNLNVAGVTDETVRIGFDDPVQERKASGSR
ncbi:MAG: hypothetical protein BGO89_09615 [Candidatus Kapaibacterium thiocyanatum]|uniref:Uncharacterized protein n=1 Tax=Candidatus Kapaibacterium thiocyanatum TaxID=1895771 RepID=A0A1M3KX28_9BACT|nr:MAG: hypothetical protein BGO89_09615 ['Candidatus Kapabacteria' thiocyanatum]